MDEEVKRHRTTQDSLETELQALRQRLFRFETLNGTVVTANEGTEEYENQISRSAILLLLKTNFSCVSFSVNTEFGKDKCTTGQKSCKERIVRYNSSRRK